MNDSSEDRIAENRASSDRARSDDAKCEVCFTVNGETKKVLAFPMERLLDVLRLRLALTGAKEGCGEGECGSCAVLVDGTLTNSCLVPVLQAQGTSITTIEGIAAGARLHALQRAFLECGGAQCGICTPGMILAAHHLLSRKPRPSLVEIQEGLSGNLCRCTGYVQIFEAVAKASQLARANEV
jgi:aerobic carbon-monoxide dehydrogenase small subunit